MSVIVRFPPSPTGPLHVGGARTALFNYLFAKQNGGQIFLRIEDTDRGRSKPEFEQNIIDSLNWLGLKFDNSEPIRQSARSEIYKQHLQKLMADDLAYQQAGETVVRLRNPGEDITFDDLIRGSITFKTRELGDFIIAKNLDQPLYHFAVVVDDWEMKVSHIIRGEDHISNTPRQILIQEALGVPRPIYAHIPLILAPDRSKLSKRHGAVSVTEYRDQGYLSEALLNYLALLGWNPGIDQEVFSLAGLVKQFSLAKVQKGGAVFNLDKLKWLNREYLRRAPVAIWDGCFPTDWSAELRTKLIPLLGERTSTLAEAKGLIAGGEYDYFRVAPNITAFALKNPETLPRTIALLEGLREADFTATRIKMALQSYAESDGRAAVLGTLRIALSGRERSPDPFTIASILGKKETLARLRQIYNDAK